jgi:protein phosphatase
MGTTLTLAYLLWPRLYVVHAGDSRCYLLRNARLHQITRDHTVAQRLVDQGILPAEEAEESRWSHVLWNCIGGGAQEMKPDVYKATLRLGDTLLLCTDGLSRCVPEKQIQQILESDRPAEETCKRLIATANAEGGPDNITVVVARFRETGAAVQKARQEEAVPVPAEPPAQPSLETVA